jgi:hypothetical protein
MCRAPRSAVPLPLLVITVLGAVVVGLLPVWPHSRAWTFAPSLLAGVVLAVALGWYVYLTLR